MKNKKVIKAVLAIAAAAILFSGIFALAGRLRGREGEGDPISPPMQSSSQPDEDPKDNSPSDLDPSAVPDLDSTQSEHSTPYPPLDIQALSPTTLTPEEIADRVDDMLAGLLVLDAQAVEQVSPRNIGGEHNPFRIMLNACLADDTLKAAFLSLGSCTSYELLDISNTSSSPNVFTATVSVTTPYMAARASELAASSEIPYVQELTRLKASGGAQRISGMDLSAIPASTDLVLLTIVVEDDVPMLYYPTSLTYGTRIPQYAFLWGAIEFQGTNNGDLLLKNDFGGGVEVSMQKFGADAKRAELASYLDKALASFKNADMDELAKLSVAGNTLGTHWVFETVYPEYQKLFSKNASFEPETWDRIKSFEYEIRYFIHTDTESDSEIYSAVITYSTIDPLTGQRAYQTKQYIMTPGGLSLGESDGAMINNLLSEILTDAFGGSAVTAESRLYLKDKLKG